MTVYINGTIPIAIGDMYVTDPGVEAYLEDADTWYQIGGASKGAEKGITVDNTTGKFIIKYAGDYKFDGVASLSPNLGMVINFALFNDTKVEKIETTLDFQNSQDTNTFSGTGILENLEIGDEIVVKAKSSIADRTLTVEFFNISLHKI